MEVRILAPGSERRARVQWHVLAFVGSLCAILVGMGHLQTVSAGSDRLGEMLTEYLGWGYPNTSLCVAIMFVLAAFFQDSDFRSYNTAIQTAFAVSAISGLIELSRYVEKIGEPDFDNPYLRLHASQFVFPGIIAVACLFLREPDGRAR